MALTTEQIQLVKATVPILKQHGKTITTVFYRNMLNAHPELKNYFNLRSQKTGEQPAALAHSVLAYATYIDDLGKLSGAVEHIAQKHVSLFIQPEQYDIVGEHLVGAFAEVLGAGLTAEVRDAWIAAYGQLAQIFIQREDTLYKEAGEWQGWRKFVVAKKEPETDTIMSFYLKPKDGKPLPQYSPGQYVSLQIPLPEIDNLHQSRQFSLSEAPRENMEYYRISVKREHTVDNYSLEDLKSGGVPGVISNKLHKLYNVGDEVELSPPRGDFFFDASKTPADAPIVLLSAGVGATPVMSILQAALAPPASSRPITWAHAARNFTGVCYGKYVKEVAAKNSNVTTRIFLKNVADTDRLGEDYHYQGRLSLDSLEEDKTLHLNHDSAQYFICGPEDWMIQTRAWLEGKGVTRDRIHIELFRTGDL
ncbi:Flavohemoprotein [Paramyrothecium foliicola]|nr:Flavohemoprotein [Paramyrothecium foliicola]